MIIKEARFVPREGEKYFFAYSDGCISCATYKNEKYDNMRIAIGNCYRTFEDASFAIEKQKVLVELQEYSTYHDKLDNGLYTIINMKNSDDSDILVVDVSKIIGDIPLVVYARKYTNDPVFFRSEKAALAAVKKVTKRRLIKYYFTGIDQDV
jgi:hypothetical protein